jgi:hypothetical protein
VEVGAEPLPPQRIAEYCNVRPAAWLVGGCECAANRGLHLQHIEQRSAAAADSHFSRVADAGQVPWPRIVLRHRFERPRVPAPVLEVLLVYREPRTLARVLTPRLVERHQAIRFAIGERPEQHAVNDGENSRRCTDRQRKRQDNSDCIAAITAEGPKGVTDVEEERSHDTFDG